MDENASDPQAERRPTTSPVRSQIVLPLAAAALVAGVAFGGFALGAGNNNPSPATLVAARTGVSLGATVTVSGTGKVEGKPDTVSFQIGFQSKALTATEALAENNSRMRTLEATLARDGVAHSGMQTSNLSIYPNTNNSGVVTGFVVDDNLNVTMHDVSQAGRAIQAAADVAGNGIQLYGINFSISKQAGLLAAARTKAIENARAEATQLANGAGASLGQVLKISTQTSSPPVYYPNSFAKAAVASSSVPLEQGSQPVSVKVTVTYRLN